MIFRNAFFAIALLAASASLALPTGKDPNYTSRLNPEYNSQINPEYSSSLNPSYNSRINPDYNSRINPNYNSRINPAYNSRINPDYNSQLNPNYNSRINPEYNSRINPRYSSDIPGKHIFSREAQAVAYLVEASHDFYLSFAGSWNGYWVRDEEGGFAIFDVKASGSAMHIPTVRGDTTFSI